MGHGPVRSATTGQHIVCCFNDCGALGSSRYEHREFRQWVYIGPTRIPQYTIYLFCSERHRALWRNSHRSLGNLPIGSKGMLT